MTAQEIFDELVKLTVVELEQRLRQLSGELEATKALLKIARARQKGKRRIVRLTQEPAKVGA